MAEEGTTDFLVANEPASFVDRDPTLTSAPTFFAPLAPASSLLKLPSPSFFAAIRLIRARLAAVSRGKPTELILALPFLVPAAAQDTALETGLALNSVFFLAASVSASSFLRRLSRWALSFAEMASPGRVKVDFVGGLADLEGTKPGQEVESLRVVLVLGARLVVLNGGAAEVDAFAWFARVAEVEDRG